MRRPGEEHGKVQTEEDTGHEHLPDIPKRHPAASTPKHGVPDNTDGDHPPERHEHTRGLGSLYECRAERERHDESDDRSTPSVFALSARIRVGASGGCRVACGKALTC